MDQNELQEQQEIIKRQQKIDRQIEMLRVEQNLPKAILWGFAAALIGAIVWAAITILTGYNIGFVAIGVGFLVGFAVQKGGKGFDLIFGIIGGLFAILGCLSGNFLIIVNEIANYENLTFLQTLSAIDYTQVPSLMIETFDFRDIIFYIIALIEGYKFSFRNIETEEELNELSQ